MDEINEDTKDREMTNEEYREELKKIFANINSTRKLRFWYRYINGIENADD